MILQIRTNSPSADVTLSCLYRNNNYCRPGKCEALIKTGRVKGKITSSK